MGQNIKIREMISLVESINEKIETQKLVEANVEQSVVSGVEALSNALRAEKGLVADMAPKLRELGYFKAGEAVSPQKIEGLFQRMKNGSISVPEAERVMQGLREVPAVKQGFMAYVRESPTFANIRAEVLPKGPQAAHDQLQLAKVQKFMNKTYGLSAEETNKLFNLPKDAPVKRITPKVGGEPTTGVKPGETGVKPGETGTPQTITGKDGISININNVNTNEIGLGTSLERQAANTADEAGSNIKKIIDDGKGKIPANVEEALIENQKNVRKISNWEKIKNVGGKILNKKWLIGLGILGGGIYLFKRIFGGYTTEEKNIPKWSPCMTDLFNNGGDNVKLKATAAGDPVVAVTTSERYPDLDAKGGLWFFHTGRVMSADKGLTKRGRWSCPGGQMQVAEGTILNEDALGSIQIVWDGEDKKQDNQNQDNKPTPLFKECADFPFTVGCKSPKIAEVQKCLGLEDRFQTGNFGPATKQALIDKKINDGSAINKDDYDKIIASCSGKQPEDVKIGPMPKVGEIPFEPEPTETKPKEEPKKEPIEPAKPEETAEQMYQRFVDEGYFRAGQIGNNRVKYKGPDLNQENLDKLNKYLKENGYKFLKDKDKKGQYGDVEDEKYVWIKIK